MLKKLCLGLLAFIAINTAHAQTKYWVFFKDKSAENFDPYTYFHKNALDRRETANLPLFDFTDLPVNKNYLAEINKFSDSMGNESRWFNAVGAWVSEKNVSKIASLPFVKSVEAMTSRGQAAEIQTVNISPADILTADTFLLRMQLERLQGPLFKKKEITGKGIRIAVLDVGFKGVDTHPAFAHLRSRGKIILTQDFIRKNDFVYGYGTHGGMVLSCIAGIYNDSLPMGMAPDAEFLLARTERGLTEWKDEEDSWLAAMEWADKNGAKIINSSLGYTHKRYFYRDMDGYTSLISRAANLAAKKGILVVTAAGNDGSGGWKYICTPADADSALTIGGTDPKSNYHINFSSYGPTADERMKPNVSAPGHAFVANSKDYAPAFGTSFSTPIISGFAACAWQMNPNLSNMQLFKEIEKAGSLYPYFDYAHGFGIPQASYFTEKETAKEEIAPTFTLVTEGENIDVHLKERFVQDSASISQLKNTKLYYHLTNNEGVILKYYVVQPQQKIVLSLDKNELSENGILRVHFYGYTEEFKY